MVITLRNISLRVRRQRLKLRLNQTRSIFAKSVRVYSPTKKHSRRIWIPPAPRVPLWPFGGNFDGTGAQLIEAATAALRPATIGRMERRHFIAAQRAALNGSIVTAAALSDRKNDDFLDGEVIPSALTWWVALQDVAMPSADRGMHGDGVAGSSPMRAVSRARP